MNEQLRRPNLTITTQAAEGLPRRRWTVAEIEAMVAAGASRVGASAGVRILQEAHGQAVRAVV